MVRQAFERKEWPVYLTGPTGTGKSSLAAYCIRGTLDRWCDAAMNDQQWPRWIVWSDFFSGLMRIRMKGPMAIVNEDGFHYECDEAAWWRRFSSSRTLVIDEIGTKVGDGALEAMRKLLDVRIGKATILTGNLNEAAICSAFDDRVLSRLSQGTWIEIKGDDRRVTGFGKRRFVVGGDS